MSLKDSANAYNTGIAFIWQWNSSRFIKMPCQKNSQQQYNNNCYCTDNSIPFFYCQLFIRMAHLFRKAFNV